MTTLAEAREYLEQFWGYKSFKPAQEIIIQNVMSGKDVLGILPTGYGKSVTFQIPALMLDGTCIVISPLIALMKDQADDANAKGITASYINSHVDEDDVEERLEALREGEYQLFYVAPERIRNKKFRDALADIDVGILAVDECHCVSRWGHDFRPAYQRIREILMILEQAKRPRPVVLAVTATATQDIEEDIAQGLGMTGEYVRVVGDPVRPNLSYEVAGTFNSKVWYSLDRIIRQLNVKDGRHIIYCGTRKGSEMVAQKVEERHGEDVVAVYHAGMTKDTRTKVQDAFKSGKVRVVVATCAFGMGIDVPDIRTVVHAGIPGSLEDYCQESGRAGRDGKPSRVILVLDDYSLTLRQGFIDRANPPYEWYKPVWDYLHSQLEPGDVLKESGETISENILDGSGKRIPSDAVLSILNGMEAHGLIERQAMARGGNLLHVNVQTLQSLVTVKLPDKKSVAETAIALWNRYVKPRLGGNTMTTQPITIAVDRAELAEEAGISETSAVKALKELARVQALELGEPYYGKTTAIRKYGADLSKHIDRQAIADKRLREQMRLRQMIDYAASTDRRQMLRDYFLKG